MNGNAPEVELEGRRSRCGQKCKVGGSAGKRGRSHASCEGAHVFLARRASRWKRDTWPSTHLGVAVALVSFVSGCPSHTVWTIGEGSDDEGGPTDVGFRHVHCEWWAWFGSQAQEQVRVVTGRRRDGCSTGRAAGRGEASRRWTDERGTCTNGRLDGTERPTKRIGATKTRRERWENLHRSATCANGASSRWSGKENTGSTRNSSHRPSARVAMGEK